MGTETVMGILEQYESYYNKYRDIYGERIAILFQVGTFHQLYGIDNEQERTCNLTEIASLLNIKETRVNTAILENNRSNPQLAGFNSVALDSNVERLVSYGYTVVVINQTGGTTANGEMIRQVAYIQSPSTIIDMTAPRDPYLISVYIQQEKNRAMGRNYDYIGMAAMDITTGQSFYYETNSSPCDPDLAIDNLKRFFQTFSPVEVIINAPEGTLLPAVENWGFRLSRDDSTDIIGNIKPIAYVNCPGSLPDIHKIPFQEKILTDLLSLDSPLEILGMSNMPVAAKALIHLLRFCADHNTNLMKSLSKPKIWGTGNHLVLDTRSILQLGILESYYDQLKTDSIYNMLSGWTVTSVGRRTLRHRILNGITHTDELTRRYDDIEKMSAASVTVLPDTVSVTATDLTEQLPMHEFFYRGLKGIRDLDRMHRKLTLGSLTPSEFYDLDQNYTQIKKLYTRVGDNWPCDETLALLNSFTGLYRAILNLEECGRCTVTEHMRNSIFQIGFNPEIDRIANDINHCDQVRTELLQLLSDLVAKGSNCCKYRGADAGAGCWVTFTKPQFTKFETAAFSHGNKIEFKVNGRAYQITKESLSVDTRNKSNIKIEISLLDELQRKQDTLVGQLRTLSIEAYRTLLEQLSEKSASLDYIANHVGLIDLNQAISRMSIKYGYCRPVIGDPGPDTSSWLHTEQLRHPLVERKCAYVAHDIQIGYGSGGMLLYGVNQSGKSCTMKSVGVAVVMAQAGFYVPASSFKFYPYQNLMTRIIGNDSIDNGLSSYAVEMMELRSILTRSNPRTLVLGDEVCHGTESASAVSLVAASLIHLDKARASFIFATHLHELSQMPEVAHIRQFHITVKFSADGKIIYDRQFKPGSGTGLYGIEVAKHLRLPADVIHNALTFRNKYFPNTAVVPVPTQSKYNSERYISGCEISGCTNKADHTHHIRYQAEATTGLIDGYRDLNQKENLIGLCEQHHNEVHHCCTNDRDMQLIIFDRTHYEYRRKLHSLDRKIEIPTAFKEHA